MSFSQEKQTVRQDYPDGFEAIDDLLDLTQPDAAAIKECVDKVCEAIRAQVRAQIISGKVLPVAKRGRGRPTKGVAKLHNDLRTYTYILVGEIEGFRWWNPVTVLVRRRTRGNRPDSRMAEKFLNVLCYICQEDVVERADGTNQQLNLSDYIDRTILADMSNQLAYAYRHCVPFSLLPGFLMQVGMTTAAAGERSGHVEAGIASRKKIKRRSDERDQAKAD